MTQPEQSSHLRRGLHQSTDGRLDPDSLLASAYPAATALNVSVKMQNDNWRKFKMSRSQFNLKPTSCCWTDHLRCHLQNINKADCSSLPGTFCIRNTISSPSSAWCVEREMFVCCGWLSFWLGAGVVLTSVTVVTTASEGRQRNKGVACYAEASQFRSSS